MKYLISYDLTNATKADYDSVDKKIKLGIDPKAKRILQSQWIVDTNIKQAEGICTRLESYIKPEDKLLVVNLDFTDKCCRNIPEYLV